MYLTFPHALITPAGWTWTENPSILGVVPH